MRAFSAPMETEKGSSLMSALLKIASVGLFMSGAALMFLFWPPRDAGLGEFRFLAQGLAIGYFLGGALTALLFFALGHIVAQIDQIIAVREWSEPDNEDMEESENEDSEESEFDIERWFDENQSEAGVNSEFDGTQAGSTRPNERPKR